MAAAASPSGGPPAAAPPAVTFEDLDNSVRNGKKKLYWSAFEVVLVTASAGGAPSETRYDAYQVNHNHLKKLHAGARGPHYVRVECKYCTAPRFTQSITVSTKKFEEHYMTLHALDALATADAKKAQQRKSARAGAGAATPSDAAERDDDMDGEDDAAAGDDGSERTRSTKRARKDGGSTPVASASGGKRARRGALTKDDDDHVAAMQGAAAAVVALSGGNNGTARTPVETTTTSPHASTKPSPHRQQTTATTPTATTLPSSLVDSSIVLDPADSDTKRAKKSYWTAYEVVICERVPRGSSDIEDSAASAAALAGSGEMVTRETRQDAWRVNHNALRRLHLDPANDTTVRVECRFCDEPKFNQSITVSTRKFEQHYYYEHGDESQRQELEVRLAAKAAAENGTLVDGANGASQDAAVYVPKRRKSWKALLMDRENAAAAAYATGVPAAKSPYAGVGGSHARGVVSARHQRSLLMNWMLHDYLPLSTVGNGHFQAFVAALDRKFELPQPQVLRLDLEQRFDTASRAMKKQIEEELKAGTAFALAVDQFLVHSSGEAVTHVSITVHFISREWEREQLVLACRAVGSAPSAEAVWVIVRDVLIEFGFPPGAFASATVRSDEAISKAAGCLSPLGARTRKPNATIILCAASALQEVAEAGVSVLRREIVEFQAINALLQQEAREASTWTDLYASVNSIVLRHKPSAETEMSQPTALSSDALAMAQVVVELLEPFVRIAEDMSSTAYPTIPMTFQYFRHLNESITQRMKTNEVGQDQLAPVYKAMHTVLGDLYHKVVHSKALVAYVLDPRFRFSNISSLDESSIRSHIVKAVTSLKGENDTTTGSPDGRSEQGEDSTGPSTGTTRPSRSLFEELATSGRRTSTGSAPSTKQDASASNASSLTELEEYLSLDDEEFNVNVLQWWQSHEAKFPSLAQVARQYLALVGTSLPASELFTRAGQELVARRSALSSATLEATVVVRATAESIGQTHTPQELAKNLPPAEEPKRRTTDAPLPTVAAPPPAASSDPVHDKDAVAVIV